MASPLLIEWPAEADEEFLIEEVEDYSKMKTITRAVLQGSVIAGAALLLTAMSTMATARHAFAQDMPAPEASAGPDAESPDALPINASGMWTGDISDDSLGSGSINLSISQKNKKLSGGWSATFTTADFLGGIEKGSLSTAKHITLKLGSSSFDKNACRLKFVSAVANGTEIQGNYQWVSCGKQFKDDKGGTIDVTPAPAT
jgi:hypothetical protein